MANETVSSGLTALHDVAIQEATIYMQSNVDLRNFITRRAVPAGSSSVRFPSYANASAVAVAEGSEVANAAVTATGVTLSPQVNAAFGTVLTDISAHSQEQLMADVGRLSAQAILTKINADIFALFDGFSTSLGSSNTDITEALIRQAVKKLIQANAPAPYYMVITPEVAEDLWTIYSTNTSNTSDRVRDQIFYGAATGDMPEIYGVKPITLSAGIDESTDVKCAVFSAAALGYASMWDFRVETARNAKGFGEDYAASACYAVGELQDSFGVELLVDGAD